MVDESCFRFRLGAPAPLPSSWFWLFSLLIWSLLPVPVILAFSEGATWIWVGLGVLCAAIGLIRSVLIGVVELEQICLHFLFRFFGLIDIAIGGISIGILVAKEKTDEGYPFVLGFTFQVISGLWRVIVAGMKSELAWYLWLLPFFLSLLSPFAFAAGIPSLVLLHHVIIRKRSKKWTGSETGSEKEDEQQQVIILPVRASESVRASATISGNGNSEHLQR